MNFEILPELNRNMGIFLFLESCY
ncbi:hypothetical protein [Neobacillus niacini]